MKKQLVQLMVLLLVLGALAAAFFGLKQYNKAQSEKGEEDMTEIAVDAALDDIVRFSYDYSGENYTFEKEGDTWYYAEDHSLEVLQYQMTGMLEGVAPLRAELIIENVADMAQYGLTEAQKTIQYETENETYVLEVGDYNSVSGVYYVREPGENTVYAVAQTTVTAFNKSMDVLVKEEETTE